MMMLLVAALGAACDAPVREEPTEDCTNAVDDDHDGQIDCADSECTGQPACAAEICGNNLDDDHDGRFDCADSDCSSLPACGASTCGNQIIEQGEHCDGTQMGGANCINQGFKSGTVTCTATCQIDTSACSNVQVESCANQIDDDGDGLADCADPDCSGATSCLCGNGVVDSIEVCDGNQFAWEDSCQAHGFPGGTLTCAANCQEVDTSSCTAPVCGDGIVSAGETCDDGNTVEHDGCSPTCQVELEPLCSGSPSLHLGTNAGDTTGGSTGFDDSCVGYGGSERIYSFTPEQSGTLIVVLTSATDQGVYVRTSCADVSTELACSNYAPGGSSEALSFAVTAGVPLSVFVDSYYEAGWSENQAGPFTLTLVLNP